MAKKRLRKNRPADERFKATTIGFIDAKASCLVVLGLILYANSFTNGYALDDGIVIQTNTYVQQGVRGIPKIFATDVYQSFYSEMNAEQQLSGGRYRPLSVATFALEQELFGSKAEVKSENDVAWVRHFNNVLLYLLSAVLLLHFLRKYVLPKSSDAAFLSSIIFLAHPLHSEVVANVKSRDEILSLLFIVLTFTAVCRFRETGKVSRLVAGLFCYFLALLSKEYAITLIVLIPLFLIVTGRETQANSLKAVLPFLAVLVVYLVLRVSIVGLGSTQENTDVLNNPYMFATTAEKWATKSEVLIRYLKLLLFPNPLSSDYSYQAIPYSNFHDAKVWLSIFLHAGMIAATVVLFIRRNVLAFALAFYLTHLFLVSNLFMDIGATMGERLIYHSSLGFALAIACVWDRALGKVENETRRTQSTMALSLLLIVPYAAVVIPRNAQWKSDASLFLNDVKLMPNSAFLNGNAGKAYLDLGERSGNKQSAMELTKKSIPFSQRAIAIHKRHVNGYLNLGVAYLRLGEFEKAEENWNIARTIYPDHPLVTQALHVLARLYHSKAAATESESSPEAVRWLEKAVRADPENGDIWYHLGEACFKTGDFDRARTAWARTLQLKPAYKDAEERISGLPPK